MRLRGQPRRRLRAGSAGEHLPLAHAAAAPIGREDFVETLPVGVARAEECTQRRLEGRGAQRGRRSEDRERVLRLGKAGAETVVAQGAGEPREPPGGSRV
jgi:hypothetical protein